MGSDMLKQNTAHCGSGNVVGWSRIKPLSNVTPPTRSHGDCSGQPMVAELSFLWRYSDPALVEFHCGCMPV
jgi:hypothetical protein